MRTHCVILLGAAILFGASLSAAAASPEEVKAETEIRSALARWVEAANRQDWKAALDVWAPDLIGWYPGIPEITYEREVENSKRPASGPMTNYQVTVNEVIVSGGLAVVRDTWTFTTKRASGDVTERVRSYEVWRRQADGVWKISRWISAPEPAATK
jgi:steroid delta-isomerase